MGPLQLTDHLLSFAAPAFFVALAVAFGARWLRLAPGPLRWWVQVAVNFTAGVAVLAAGLWHFGVDGKMATYAALVAAVATAQWLCGRGWKR
jgi:zinc transporter ZupT